MKREISVSQAAAAGAPDLDVTGLTPDPATPTQNQPVRVSVKVYNKGTARSGSYKVLWWAGENFPAPACEWKVEDGSAAGGGRTLTCDYTGYKSPYAKLITKVVVDSDGAVAESDEGNNTLKREISVRRP